MIKRVFFYFFVPIFMYASKADALQEFNITAKMNYWDVVDVHIGSFRVSYPSACHVGNKSIAHVKSRLEHVHTGRGWKLKIFFEGLAQGTTSYDCGLNRPDGYEKYVHGTITVPPVPRKDFSLSINQPVSFDFPLGIENMMGINPHCVVVSTYVTNTATSYTYQGLLYGIHVQFTMTSEPPFNNTSVLYSCGLWPPGEKYRPYFNGQIKLIKTPTKEASKMKNMPKKALKK